MKIHAALLLLTATMSFSQGSFAKPGEWGSSGGGSGVACFTNETAAKAADHFIDNGLAFSKEVSQQMTSIDVLDYWEWTQTRPHQLLTPYDRSADQLLDGVQYVMQNVTPMFAFRLKQTRRLIAIDKWIAKDSLPRIHDAKPTVQIPVNCRLVQLVARYSSDKRNTKDGPSLKAPIIKTEYNADLFKKLTPLNQAILRLHEQFYLMGQAAGRNSSDVIRPLVMQFFKPMHVDEQVTRQLRISLVKAISDYPNFASEDFKTNVEFGTAESRYKSLLKILKIVSDRSEKCYKENNVTFPLATPELAETWKSCHDKAFNLVELQSQFSQQMDFVFVTYYLLDMSEKKIEAEIFLTPNDDPSVQHTAGLVMKSACELIDGMFDRYPKDLEPMITNAGDYCASPFPTEIDQN